MHVMPTEQRINACRACGMVYADHSAPVDYASDSIYTASALYGSDAEHEGRYREIVTRVQAFAKPDAHVLDVGCATGGLLRALRSAGFVHLTGISLSQGEVAACRAQDFDAEVRNISDPPDGLYDLIILSHVLEHVHEVGSFLRDLRGWFAPAGLLYVEVPDACGYVGCFQSLAQGFNQEHVNHFSLLHLEELLRLHRFGPLGTKGASGRGTTTLAGTAEYPITWVTASLLPPIDGGLHERIEAYTLELNEMMNAVHRNLRKSLDGLTQIAIWGLGQTTLQIAASGLLAHLQVIARTDSNPAFHNRVMFPGAPAAVVPERFAPPPEVPILVCSKMARDEIVATIRARGLTNRTIDVQP